MHIITVIYYLVYGEIMIERERGGVENSEIDYEEERSYGQ
jgi:hypothetical protein